jgi:hypothetical protein
MLMPPTRSTPADDHHCSDSSGSNPSLVKLMPPTRSTPADDHHCSDSSGSNHACDTDASHEEHTSRRSPLYKRQQPSQTCRCPQRGAHQPTTTTALTAAVATIACETDASHEEHTSRRSPLHKRQQSTIANTPMPSPRRATAAHHHTARTAAIIMNTPMPLASRAPADGRTAALH